MVYNRKSAPANNILKAITKNIPSDDHFAHLQLISIAICSISFVFLVLGLYFVSQGHEEGINLCILSMIFDALWSSYVQYRLRGLLKLDEREVFVQWKAIATGAVITCAIAIGWIFLLGSDDKGQVWQPTKPNDWWAIGIFLVGSIGQVSGLAAASLNLFMMRTER